MAYQPIDINYEDLTIMGVAFPDLETLESAANAIGSNMFDGFVPSQGLIQFYRDWRAGKISNNDFLSKLKDIV
jgi:putative transcriptional regulator